MSANPCGICAGEGRLLNGNPCVCGDGTESGECQALRREMVSLEEQLAVRDRRIGEVEGENERLSLRLIHADILAAVIDEMVCRRTIDARCAIADARLDYGEPFTDREQRGKLLARRGMQVSSERDPSLLDIAEERIAALTAALSQREAERDQLATVVTHLIDACDSVGRAGQDICDEYHHGPGDDCLAALCRAAVAAARVAQPPAHAAAEATDKLQRADALARVIDEQVERGALDSRSAIADARLKYGEPFRYAHAAAEGELAALRKENQRLRDTLEDEAAWWRNTRHAGGLDYYRRRGGYDTGAHVDRLEAALDAARGDAGVDPMPEFINVADLKNPDDPRGRSYRECNRDLTHAIPVGTLVEILPSEYDDEGSNAGVRLYVARHDRDCDQTPLYALGVYETAYDYTTREYSRPVKVLVNGYAEEGLRVVAQDADRAAGGEGN